MEQSIFTMNNPLDHVLMLPPKYGDCSASERLQFDVPLASSLSSSQMPPQDSAMLLQTFVFTQGFFNSEYRVFSSPESLAKYKSYKNLSPGANSFAVAKQQQNQSVGLPLLISKKSWGYTREFMSLSTAVPSPNEKDRLYDDSQDHQVIGEVCAYRFARYGCFTMQIHGTKMMVLEHLELPIIDFQIQQNRFRFVKQPSERGRPGDFVYELYLLAPGQASLFDGMGCSGRVSKSNALLDRRFLKCFWSARTRNIQQFESSHSIGTLENVPSKTFTTIKETSKFTIYTSASNHDSNAEVELRTLAFLAVALIVQRIEEIRAVNGSGSMS